MAKPHDKRMKRLVKEHPEDLLSLVIEQALFKEHLPNEFESEESYADALLQIELHNKPCLVHMEFQQSKDARMPYRLLAYNVQAMKHNKYQPVYSCVIYLRKHGKIVESPLVVTYPNDDEILRFHYGSIALWKIPTEQLLHTGRKGLLPLLPLTREGAHREVVDTMITGIMTADKEPESELLALAYGFAASVFTEEDDRDWLRRRFMMLKDFLRDTWAFQEMMEEAKMEAKAEAKAEAEAEAEARAEAKIQEIEKARVAAEKKAEEARIAAEKKAEEARIAAEKKAEEARIAAKQQELGRDRELIIDTVVDKFPILYRAFKQRTAIIDDPTVLLHILIEVTKAQTTEEAASYLDKLPNIAS